MYAERKVLGVVIARGGSKGLPRKNLRRLGDRPLIAWTIEAARGSRYLDRCILSSDDDEIIDIARSWGADVPFVRPAHLATDDVPAVGPILHAVDRLPGYDYVVLLQPTTPFRSSEDIDGCIAHCLDHRATSCVSVAPARKNPYWMFRLGDHQALEPVVGDELRVYLRQQLPPAYVLNGAVYVNEIAPLRATQRMITGDTRGYVMPNERSVDIDTELDFRFAESLLDMVAQKAA